MVFSSQTFLFFFLPLAGLCVLIRSKPVQNAMLLIASLIFYAWGEPKMVVLMVLVTLVAYGSGFAIVHFEARPRAKKAALIAAIVASSATSSCSNTSASCSGRSRFSA